MLKILVTIIPVVTLNRRYDDFGTLNLVTVN